MTKEDMVIEYWTKTNKELWEDPEYREMPAQTINDLTNYLTRKEFNITQAQLERMYYSGKGECAMTALEDEEKILKEDTNMETKNIVTSEELKRAEKEEKRKHKQVLWNNRYYVLYKILTVVCVTIVVCTMLILGNR